MREKTSLYKYEQYGDIRIAWTDDLDGGGSSFGRSFVPVTRHLFGKTGRAFEFCAGPGFIGFYLIAEGLCDSLCLSDINPEAVALMEHTVEINGLGSRVSVYLSDGLKAIPESEKWDLVVSNPPHFFSESHEDHLNDLRRVDSQWHVHEEFYANVGRHLNRGASILFQENYMGSSEDTFAEMLRKNGLVLVDSLMIDTDRHRDNNKFFMWVKERGHGLWWGSDETRAVRVVASEILGGGHMTLQPGRYQVIFVNDTAEESGIFMTKAWDEKGAGRMEGPVQIRVTGIGSGTSGKSSPVLLNPGRYFITHDRLTGRFATLDIEAG